MRPFDYTRAAAVDEAIGSLDAATRPYAGGTDLLTRMKIGITTPERLVDVKSLDLPGTIETAADGGVTIGALATLADIERHGFAPPLALLAEAASKAATPQLRERATVGGNLLQRPRCWYYRNADVDCWLKGGDGCPAKSGRNEHHAIFGEGPCVAVHPSDLATCLTALGAQVTLRGVDGERTLAMDEFFAEPEEGRRGENVVRDDELVRSVTVPAPADGARSVYLKAMDRKVWAFALVGVAAVASSGADGERTLRLAASGVAAIPWRLGELESRLADVAPGDEAALDAAIDAGLAGAAPLSNNAYKLPLLKRLVRRAVDRLDA